MSYFHALAVFEARGFSLEGTDRAAASLFKALHHPQVRYYEHDTIGGLGPYSSSAALYFTVVVDLDVNAQSEERAEDVVEEVLDVLSTDEIQYIAHGLTPGERRVQMEQRILSDEERESEQESREERSGRGRRSRGRRRRRGAEREADSPREEVLQEIPQRSSEAETAGPLSQVEASTPQEPEETSAAVQSTLVERELLSLTPDETVTSETLAAAPPRSSPSMRVTLSVTLRASELTVPINGSALPDQQELIALATAEARRRHPELPADLTPESEMVSQPWGETMLTLTWHYDVPIPSASDVV